MTACGTSQKEYTWSEFEELSPEEQDAYFDTFSSSEAFEEWMREAQQEEQAQIEKPWENDGKSVSEYTWEEFEALSLELKDAFFEAFESVEDFEAWMNNAQQEEPAQIEEPWENGGKPVSEYTWAEFEALSLEQKDAFFEAFESVEAFEVWMNSAQLDNEDSTGSDGE